jgi:hypothetical protein
LKPGLLKPAAQRLENRRQRTLTWLAIHRQRPRSYDDDAQRCSLRCAKPTLGEVIRPRGSNEKTTAWNGYRSTYRPSRSGDISSNPIIVKIEPNYRRASSAADGLMAKAAEKPSQQQSDRRPRRSGRLPAFGAAPGELAPR